MTRRGGVVAAYLWDYAGRMELIRRFWDAAVALDPAAAELDEAPPVPARRSRTALAVAWADAGLSDVSDHGDRRPDAVRRLRRLLGSRSRSTSARRPGTRAACRRNVAMRSANGCAPPCRPAPRAPSTSSPAPGPSAAAPDRCPGRRDHIGGRGGAGPHCRPWTSRSRPPRPSSATAPAPTSSTPCSRSRPSSSATTTLPDDTVRELKRLAIEARLHGGSLPVVGRRPGLDGDGAGPRPRAAGPGDGRPVELHPGGVQRARPLHARAASAVPRPEPARRAQRELRDHRARPGVRRADPRLDGGPRPGHRGVRPQRGEVVRHRSVGHGLHDLPLPRDRRRRAAADAVPRRLRHARRRADRRPRLHPHVRRPPPAVHAATTCACRPTRCSAASARPTR